jgi:hypothetical protein
MKLTAQKGGACREGISSYHCAPSCLPVGRDPALKGGDCGALAGQKDLNAQNKRLSKTLLNTAPFHLPVRYVSFTPLML